MLQLNFLREKDAPRIINKVKGYDYVSFDIFDTLLKRDVAAPTDVFKIVGNIHSDKQFAKARIVAERNLRQKSGKEEITLNEIYEAMGEKYSSYKETELEVEEKVLVPSLFMKPVYEYCRENHKKIIIISDMYLPPEFLRKVLAKNGIAFNYCFISCEYGVQKVSGNLFRKALERMGIKPSEMIHIGDSPRGDHLGAKKAGIKNILIPKVLNRTPWIDLSDKNQKNSFNAFVNNHMDLDQNKYYQFGYAYFGPVLYGFVNWLHDSVKNQKIFFFARDGYLVKHVYDALFPDADDDYIYLSRRALSAPLLWMHSSWGEFENYITITRYFTVGTLLERLGLDPELYKEKLTEYNLTTETLLQEKTFRKNESLKKFYESIEEDIVYNSKKEYEAFVAYFKKKKFAGDIAVVDIGWNGSMQRYLCELMELADVSVRMTGYYFGMRKNLPYTKMKGYFYDKDDMSLEPVISFMQGLFESFFLSHEGSTKTYRINEDNQAEPVLYDPEYTDKEEELKAFTQVQDGAAAFCKDYAKTFLKWKEHYTSSEYGYNLFKFGNEPTLRDVELFGDFRFYDTNVVYMAKPGSFLSYAGKPRILLRDFSYSVWKAGFLKRLFKAQIPYEKLYAKAKSLK